MCNCTVPGSVANGLGSCVLHDYRWVRGWFRYSAVRFASRGCWGIDILVAGAVSHTGGGFSGCVPACGYGWCAQTDQALMYCWQNEFAICMPLNCADIGCAACCPSRLDCPLAIVFHTLQASLFAALVGGLPVVARLGGLGCLRVIGLRWWAGVARLCVCLYCFPALVPVSVYRPTTASRCNSSIFTTEHEGGAGIPQKHNPASNERHPHHSNGTTAP